MKVVFLCLSQDFWSDLSKCSLFPEPRCVSNHSASTGEDAWKVFPNWPGGERERGRHIQCRPPDSSRRSRDQQEPAGIKGQYPVHQQLYVKVSFSIKAALDTCIRVNLWSIRGWGTGLEPQILFSLIRSSRVDLFCPSKIKIQSDNTEQTNAAVCHILGSKSCSCSVVYLLCCEVSALHSHWWCPSTLCRSAFEPWAETNLTLHLEPAS